MWNFLLGYVMIQAEGKNLERFLNLLLLKRLDISNVRRTGANTLTLNIITSDFYRLRSLIQKNGIRIKIKILEKHGLFVHLLLFRFRKVLLLGWVIVLALLIIASKNIWFINVSGCDVVSESEVIEMLADMGIKRGTKKSDFTTLSLSNNIMSRDKRIAWAGANISGVVLNVDIKEAIMLDDANESSKCASIYASMSGKIKRITALMGKPCVRVGDIVKKGDALITGDLSSETVSGLFVRARGEVIAEVVYTFSQTASVMQKTLIRTGNYKDTVHVGLFSCFFNENKSGYEFFEEEFRTTQTLPNCVLPLRADIYRCYELKEGYQEADTLTLTETAKRMAEERMKEELNKQAVILSKNTTVTTLEDGSVRADIVVVAEQNIAETREF